MDEYKKYLLDQANWLDKYKIKKGSVISIERAAESYKFGWAAGWPKDMDVLIGKRVIVDLIDGNYGISFFYLRDRYYVPYFICRTPKLRIG